MNSQTNNKILFFLLIFISFGLISAFVIEYGLGHKPCKLCLYQRIPYFLSIILLLIIFFIKNYQKILLALLAIIFLFSAILAFYHFGIEQGFYQESLMCKNTNLSNDLTKEEILKNLNLNVISCKNVTFSIFGFSLAAINTIFSIALSVIFVRLFVIYGKN